MKGLPRSRKEIENKFKKAISEAKKNDLESLNKPLTKERKMRLEIERIQDKQRRGDLDLEEWIHLIDSELTPILQKIREVRMLSSQRATRFFRILSAVMIAELKDRDRHDTKFSELKTTDKIFTEFKRSSDARVQANRRLTQDRVSKIKRRDNSRTYQEACNLAILEAIQCHLINSPKTRLRVERPLPEKSIKWNSSKSGRISWEISLENYLTEMHRAGKLKLPDGTIFALKGKQDDRLKVRKGYIKSILDMPLEELAMNIVLLEQLDMGPLLSLEVTKIRQK